jgi:uncharacterized protein (TIGR02001 family)
MKKILAIVAMALITATAAQAQVTGNLGLTSDYRFRGISQSQNAPAVQGGIDYAHSSGFYVGNWNSSVSSDVYTNGSGVESDLYAGFKKDIYKGLTLDVGSYNYFYPRATNGTSTNFDTNELFVGLGYGPVSVKYSQSLSNYFGTANSKNSQYYQADFAQPLTYFSKNLSLLAHVGRTEVNNNSSSNYTDYNVGLGYNLQGWDLAAKYYTNSGTTSSFQTANTINGQRLYKDAAVVSVSKSF